METVHPDDQVIIGIYSSVAGSGKSAVANLLHCRGFDRVSFADPIKSMVYSMLVDLGLEPKDAYLAIAEQKAEIIEKLGISGRQLLRTLGTEWGRDHVHPEIWLLCWEAQAARYQRVVADDVRFRNEADLIKQRGGQLWRIIRPGIEEIHGEHRSEGGLDDYDFDVVIVNDGSLGDLAEKVYLAVHEHLVLNFPIPQTSQEQISA